MPNFDTLVPRLLGDRGLNRLIYFREGKNISDKLRERLHSNYHGSVRPCHKSADIPLTIKATQLASKVDTIIIMSGDSDFIELVRHLKGEGVRVEIAAVPATTSRLLLEDADYFHPIDKDDCFLLEPRKPQRAAPQKKEQADKQQEQPQRKQQAQKKQPQQGNKKQQPKSQAKEKAKQQQKAADGNQAEKAQQPRQRKPRQQKEANKQTGQHGQKKR
jgi:Mg-chelatase subunit ChlI